MYVALQGNLTGSLHALASGEYRAVFDADIPFSNGGGLQAQDFRVDIRGPETSHDEIVRLFVTSLDLLMTETATVSNVRIIEEAHKGTRGGPSDPRVSAKSHR